MGYTLSCFVFRLATFEHIERKLALVNSAWVAALYTLGSGRSPLVQTPLAYATLLPAVILSFRYVWKSQIRGRNPGRPINLKDRVVIVTGSNSGIGVETARSISNLGAHVVLACRTKETADKVCADIRMTTGNENVEVMELDLGSFKSVRAFATAFKAKFDHLDVLVQNAGIMLPSRKTTPDGLEMMMQVNCFATYLLTMLLIPSLRKSTLPGGARVTLVSSSIHKFAAFKDGGFDFADPMCKDKPLEMLPRYGQSKLGLETFKAELHRRLRAHGDSICVNSLMPGTIASGITRNLHYLLQLGHQYVLSSTLNKTVITGSHTTVHVATASEIAGLSGMWFEHCRVAPQPEVTHDAIAGARLWSLAESLTGFKSSEVDL